MSQIAKQEHNLETFPLLTIVGLQLLYVVLYIEWVASLWGTGRGGPPRVTWHHLREDTQMKFFVAELTFERRRGWGMGMAKNVITFADDD